MIQRREEAHARRLGDVPADAGGDAVMVDAIAADEDNALLDYEEDFDHQDEAMNVGNLVKVRS